MIVAFAIPQADTLARAGRGEEAAALLARAGDGGDARALVHLAMWRLQGQPVARDLPAARALLARARAMGDVAAAVMEAALCANGTGGVADWAGAVAILRDVAARDRVAAAHLALAEAMAIDDAGWPTVLPEAEELAPAGAVVRYPALLTPAECEHLARGATDLMQPAVVVDQDTGAEFRHPYRTSDGGVIGPTRETLPIRAINARVAAVTGTHIDQGESLTVLRYQPGQEFRPHSDALPGTANQRVVTVLLYLNQGFGGGETVFPRHGLSVTPRGGDALVFTNVTAEGKVDPRALHAGVPVTSGVKWLATRWIRARAFSVWAGPDGETLDTVSDPC